MVIVRNALASDAGAILAFCQQIGSETDNLSYGEEGVSVSVADEGILLSEIQKSKTSHFLVAEEAGEIVGNVVTGGGYLRGEDGVKKLKAPALRQVQMYGLSLGVLLRVLAALCVGAGVASAGGQRYRHDRRREHSGNSFQFHFTPQPLVTISIITRSSLSTRSVIKSN